MLLPEDVDGAAASPEELRRLVAELLDEVARLRVNGGEKMHRRGGAKMHQVA